MKIHIFWGDLTDISARKEALLPSQVKLGRKTQWYALWSTCLTYHLYTLCMYTTIHIFGGPPATLLPDVTEVSVEWLAKTDMIMSPALVHPVRYFESQVGSQIPQGLSTTPDRRIVTLSAIFDSTNADGFVLCYTMKVIDDVFQTVYKLVVSTCV